MCRILEQHGFREVRRRGSHIVMQRADPASSTVTVPVPDHAELKIGTLLSIVRQSKVPRAAFEVES